MEARLTSGSDTLIAGLNFKPPSQTAQYCLTNRQVRYFVESGNKFDPVSSRVIRFRIDGDQGFLEASSVRLQFTLTNLKSDATLTPISPCGSLFRRARLFCSSQFGGRHNRAVDPSDNNESPPADEPKDERFNPGTSIDRHAQRYIRRYWPKC